MDFKQNVWPVQVKEVAVCETPGDGIIVVMDLANRVGEVVSLCLAPEKAADLGERLRRAYLETKALSN